MREKINYDIMHGMKRQLSRIPITQKGFDALLVEQAELKQKRKAAVINLKTARDMGDLSENGLYKGARFALNAIDGRLRQLDMQIKLAEIQSAQKGEIGLESHVTLLDGSKEVKYQIVGTYEADPLQHKISLSSPLGKALMGKKVGDNVIIQTPIKTTEYVIKKIS
jgi:transcription elongation factor GreA